VDCGSRALGVRARRERQRAKQTLHAVKLRGGDDFLYDVASAKSVSTETSSVGSSASRECRPLATELASVENRLDAEEIPHTSLSHARSLATELTSVGAGAQPSYGRRVVQNHAFQRAGIHQLVGGETS